DVLAAGMAVCGGVEFGYLHGHVYDAANNQPIGGATVTAVPGGAIMATTDPNGYYTMTLIPGVYDVTASKAGYAPQTVQDVPIYTDTVTTQDFYLEWQGTWTLLPDNPFDYTRFDCVWYDDGTGPSAYNQKVYCPGGRTGSSTEDPSIWRFNPVNQTWSDTGHDVYEDVSNYTANILCDENCGANGPAIYIVGGYDAETSSYINYVQRYYPRTGAVGVVTTDPWPVTIGGYGTIPGACVSTPDQSKIYCFGAWESNAAPYFSNQTWEYDPTRPAGSRWQQITTANLSVPRGYIFAAVQGNYIYAIGGDYQYTGTDLVPTNVVERLDLTNLAAGWQVRASMPVALSQGRGFGLDVDTLGLNVPVGKIYTAGGGDWPAETTEAMEYDIASNAWNQGFSDLNIARRNHAGVFIPLCTPDDPTDLMPALLVVGGRSGSDTPPFPQPEYFPFAVAGPPEASFDSNSPVCLGETMAFTDTSQATPPVTAWHWDFGDGGTSSLQNPTHLYASTGNFVVTLVVTNSEGSDSVTGTVTVNPLP
ncbi:MAG: PKD domain-containing protein, partial [Anaerolineae bacterium]